jgi:hypothetical protein
VTSLGVLKIRRRYWQYRCGADGGYSPDAVLGLDGRFSRVVQKHLCRLAADVSFAKAREHLHELLGVSIAAETVRKLVERRAKAMASFQPKDDATAKSFQTAKGEVEFAVDAGKVNTRENGWKDRKIAVVSKREAGPSSTPEQWADDRLPAATMVVAFAMIAASKVFRKTWRPTLKKLGVTAFATVQALGDGASWIWKSVRGTLTGCIETLDVFHANQRVNRCAQAIFGEGTAEAKAAFERGRGLLLKDGWNGVCVWVAELLAVEDSDLRERRRRATERLLKYFLPHAGRLNYRDHLSQGRAIGSGAVEGQAKTLGLRLKARGARWRSKNVRAMASLVCVRNSSQWRAYWELAA